MSDKPEKPETPDDKSKLEKDEAEPKTAEETCEADDCEAHACEAQACEAEADDAAPVDSADDAASDGSADDHPDCEPNADDAEEEDAPDDEAGVDEVGVDEAPDRTEFMASPVPTDEAVPDKTEFMASPLPSDEPAPDKTEFMAAAPPPPPPPTAHEPTEFMASPMPSPAPSNPPENTSPPVALGKAKQQQFAEGEVLNGIYRVTRFLARGGMGEVYEATNIHQQSERVAIKVMLPHLAQDELVAAMFSKEAEMLTRLHHEAIVPYRMSARDAEGKPYIVTEFIDGPSLEEKLGKLKLDELEFAGLAQKLAAGLGTAHSLGAVHRDIAPDNVLLSKGDPSRPKIIDFGIAKDARENTGTIVGDGFAGKLKYVAPEQLGEFDRNIGPWTDLYSLALTLRAVAAGKHSDMGGSLSDAVIKRQKVPDLSPIPERFHPAFEMALQPNPADRPQSMAEFILRLGDIGNGTAHPTGLMPGTGAGSDQKAGTSKQAKAKKEKKPKKGKAPNLAKTPAAGDKPKADGALAGLTKNPAVLIGGGVAALLLVVVVSIVFLTSGGGDVPTGSDGEPIAQGSDGASTASSGAQSGGTSGLDSPKVQQALNKALADVNCAWLTFEGTSGGVAEFTGGAANPAAAQTKIISALEAVGAGSASIDVSNVIRFTDKSCAAVDALRQVRSATPIIASPQEVYEAEEQQVTRDDGAVIAEGSTARVPVRIANVPASQQIALIQLEADVGLSVISRNREEVEFLVEGMKGNLSADGMAMPLGVEFEGPDKDSYGIVVITSASAMPSNLMSYEATFNADWAKRFGEAAKAGKWKADIMWFSVVNRQSN